ncbi:hypothetical protein [Caldalkalibacillus salinus]|uniref:hypothetical protein n=1 Tax=Caldalkalibacillus salinus TaxID=2803787 RepID=UPI001922F920|nr:hypothetical protein [Caldalkalibacillus salinus]
MKVKILLLILCCILILGGCIKSPEYFPSLKEAIEHEFSYGHEINVHHVDKLHDIVIFSVDNGNLISGFYDKHNGKYQYSSNKSSGISGRKGSLNKRDFVYYYPSDLQGYNNTMFSFGYVNKSNKIEYVQIVYEFSESQIKDKINLESNSFLSIIEIPENQHYKEHSIRFITKNGDVLNHTGNTINFP